MTASRERGSAMAKAMLLVLGPARTATVDPLGFRRHRSPAATRSGGGMGKGGALMKGSGEANGKKDG